VSEGVVAVGAGAWGKNIVQTLHEMEELGAIVDTNDERRKSLAGEYPETDVHASIAEAPIDRFPAATVATPAATHYEVAHKLLDDGLDVYVEKPVTLQPSTAEKLVRSAEDHDATLMVGHLLVYTKAMEEIRNVLDSGELGAIHGLHQQRSKLGRVRTEENVLWSFGVHDLAVFQEIVDESPESVEASGHAVLQADVQDDVYAHLTYPSGVQAHLHVSWLWPERERRLLIQAENGFLVYDEIEGTVTLHDHRIRDDLSTKRGDVETLLSVDDDEPLRTELEHFISCSGGDRTPRSDGHQGLEVVRILNQLEEAMT
jgi:predicted dehydrogenase